jgi:hypothetical protein
MSEKLTLSVLGKNCLSVLSSWETISSALAAPTFRNDSFSFTLPRVEMG